jgi:hypothetical protein
VTGYNDLMAKRGLLIIKYIPKLLF